MFFGAPKNIPDVFSDLVRVQEFKGSTFKGGRSADCRGEEPPDWRTAHPER
jgi:hypothetical protein